MKILLTRNSSAMLAQEVNCLGHEWINFPCIITRGLPLTDDLRLQLNILSYADLIIFLSPRAVEYGLALMRQTQSVFAKNSLLLAIGSATADELRTQGYRVDLKPPENFSSEGLLELPQLAHCEGKQIVLITGVGGRDLLQQTLQSRQAIVTKIAVYERSKPQTPLDREILTGIDLIIVTSQTALENLLELVSDPELLSQKRLVVSSVRLHQLAKSLGFTKLIMVAKNASDAALLTAISTVNKTLNTSDSDS